MKKLTAFVLALLVFGCAEPPEPAAQNGSVKSPVQQPVELLLLGNAQLNFAISPQMGGRVLEFSLADKPNLLKVGEPVETNPEPEVTAVADNIGYLGHTVWLGPQSDWWKFQNENPQRRDVEAQWPPDPWLVQAKNTVVRHSENVVTLAGEPSPVSGVQVNKTFSLDPNYPDRVKLAVELVNTREDSDVSWDIWFNTRVSAATKVYVPVADENAFHKRTPFNDSASPLAYEIQNNLFSLLTPPPEAGKKERNGKFFIQPSQGWIAAFSNEQLFIIQFPLLDKSEIHPEQGHVELYMAYSGEEPDKGLLELEVHAAYKTLAPGERMAAEETWIVLPYVGENTNESRIAFLLREIGRLSFGK